MDNLERYKKRKQILNSSNQSNKLEVNEKIVNEFLNSKADITTFEKITQEVECHYEIKYDLNVSQDEIKEFLESFSLKNDKYDYMIAGTCGVISGLVDILFVGAPLDSKLGGIADEHANKITEKFAGFLGFDENTIEMNYKGYTQKKLQEGKIPLDFKDYLNKNRLQFLERKFKINYDQATTNGKNGTDGFVTNLSASNHHLKSLGHSPDIIGLFFSILNQFTNTSSFINNGKLITIETKESELNLQGHDFISKVFCGVANWFGHLMSDWTGSNSSIEKCNRGSGIPIPFYNLFQILNVGEFGQHKQTFATITTKVFEQGYDARHGMAMAIPVLINELLIRFMYTMKARFYHQKEWEKCIPQGNVPEVRRMLLVGHGTLCIMDGADAAVRSGGDMVQFLLRTNLLAWGRFGQLAIQELNARYDCGYISKDAMKKFLEERDKSFENCELLLKELAY